MMNSLKKEHVVNCMFSNWFLKFHHLTMKSYIIPLPDDFVKYLLEDGPLFLPKDANIESLGSNHPDEDNDWDEEETNNEDQQEIPEFPDLIKQIKEILEKLNRKAFPKMNWSSPKDAVWMTGNSLRCSTPGEIILLLKSSDFITYDLTSPFKLCEDSESPDPVFQKELVLRKWANLVTGMEFRCFVRERKLIAACQRHYRQYFDYLDAQKDTIKHEIYGFLQENIINEFPDSNFVADIYKKRDGGYWVIDFNLWGSMTDPLMFTWEELESMEPNQLSGDHDLIYTSDGEVVGEFRCASKDTIMQPSQLLSHRMPQDFMDLSTGQDAKKLVDFLRMKMQNDNNSDSSDEDETWRLPSQ